LLDVRAEFRKGVSRGLKQFTLGRVELHQVLEGKREAEEMIKKTNYQLIIIYHHRGTKDLALQVNDIN